MNRGRGVAARRRTTMAMTLDHLRERVTDVFQYLVYVILSEQ